MNQRAATGRTLTALMFKDVATFRRAAHFAVETKIRAEAPGHLTLIIPIRDKHLFEQRGFTFRELYIRHVPWAARDSEATRSRTHPRWYMECVICRRGETRPGTAVVTMKRNSSILVIKGVPADICASYGEEHVGAATMAQLLRTANEVSRAGVEVDVREYMGP